MRPIITYADAPPGVPITRSASQPSAPLSSAFIDLVRRIPKAELHCHLDGSLRPATLLELSLAQGIVLPTNDAASLGAWMRVDDARDLGDYLARFDVTLAVMQHADALERVAYELVLDAAAENVRYIEVRFCPALNTRAGLSLDDVMRAVLRGLKRGEIESGTMARVIVCALRNLPTPHSMQMAELAVAFRHDGVVAFDLAGGEAHNPASAHVPAFAFARMHDLAVTVHAGEGDGAHSMREAIHLCGADRIGHGTRLFEDPPLEAYVIDRQLPLEVCPTSNVQTRVVRSFAQHPLGRYLDEGAVVTINTDNRLMSGVSLTDEYLQCAAELGFNFTKLMSVGLAAFKSAFLSFAQRRVLLQAVGLEFVQLHAAAKTVPMYEEQVR